jgi:hypothetical protein
MMAKAIHQDRVGCGDFLRLLPCTSFVHTVATRAARYLTQLNTLLTRYNDGSTPWHATAEAPPPFTTHPHPRISRGRDRPKTLEVCIQFDSLSAKQGPQVPWHPGYPSSPSQPQLQMPWYLCSGLPSMASRGLQTMTERECHADCAHVSRKFCQHFCLACLPCSFPAA